MSVTSAGPLRALLVVDAANVVGSRPDGWWRDRAAAAGRLVAGLARLPERRVLLPDDRPALVLGVRVVLEGQARGADVTPTAGVSVVLAPGEGDDTIAEVAATALTELAPAGLAGVVVVVTADRGLRERLPAAVASAGPRWLWALVDASPV